jgi:hypothetical protein
MVLFWSVYLSAVYVVVNHVCFSDSDSGDEKEPRGALPMLLPDSDSDSNSDSDGSVLDCLPFQLFMLLLTMCVFQILVTNSKRKLEAVTGTESPCSFVASITFPTHVPSCDRGEF